MGDSKSGYSKNALRYLGIEPEEISQEIIDSVQKCADQIIDVLRPRYIYKCFNLAKENQRIKLIECNFQFPGDKAYKHLFYSNRAIIVCATLGSEVDELLISLEKSDIEKAIIMDSVAEAALESFLDSVERQLTDVFQEQFTTRLGVTLDDLPQVIQKDLISILDTERKIGVTYDENKNRFTPKKSSISILGMK